MGMYTALVFKAKLRPEGVEQVCKVYERFEAREDPIWAGTEFGEKFFREGFIPFGSSSYLEDEREEFVEGKGWTEGLDAETATWVCSCELKNYQGEIEFFLREVLPYLICEPCDVWVCYEETLFDRDGEWPEPMVILPVRHEDG